MVIKTAGFRRSKCLLAPGLPVGGFTLIEMLLVLLVVAIIAMMAIPSYYPVKARGQILEALGLADKLKPNIESLYVATKKFPEDNEKAGLPEPEYLIGNFTKLVTLEDGALHITLGNKVMPQVEGNILTLRPITVIDSPTSPMSWVCGYSGVPAGMKAAGKNKTDVERKFLPVSCR